jgi:SNF2 family DNA or RNA helicase
MITILKHQKKVIDFVLKDTNRGVLVFHSVGSGKTLTALLASKQLLIKYPTKKVIIATPASLISNFEREIDKIRGGKEFFKDKVFIYSYQRLVNILSRGESRCSDTIFIIDEAHNINGGGVTYKSFLRCSKKAFKIILLSATPVKNHAGEIARQLSILEGRHISPEIIDNINNLNDKIRKREIMDKFFKCKISYFLNEDKKHYPFVTEKKITFEMPLDYYKSYFRIQSGITDDIPDFLENTRNLTIFFNGIRRAVNTLNEPSEKIKWVISTIAENISNNKKILVYSNWLSGGISVIEEILKKAEISFSKITGGISKEVKDKNIKKFNEGKTKILLISASGSEGLNLKEVRTVVILEPHWNMTRIHQVIGRASRYMSHSKLPLKDRNVTVYQLILKKPKDYKEPNDNLPSADILLLTKSNDKQVLIDKFYKWLKLLSIEKDNDC